MSDVQHRHLIQGAPKYLSSDNDPLFRYHLWQANLRMIDVDEVKTVPYTPLPHPFVERLIGTIRRDFIDQVLFWNARDLEQKLEHSASITTLIARTLHLKAKRPQISPAKPLSTVPLSAMPTGILIAAAYTSHPQPPERNSLHTGQIMPVTVSPCPRL